MRQLTVLSFISLDGIMQAPKLPEEDRSGGFKGGGWADPYWDEVMKQVGVEAMSEPYDVLFGRNTYDAFAAHAGNDHPMHDFKKYVATSRPDTLRWKNSKSISGNIATEISRLKGQNGPLLQVHGSCQLVQLLLANELIDEFRLWTFPVVLGTGKKLFGEGTIPNKMKLVKSCQTSNGVIMSFYRPESTIGISTN